MTTPNPATLGPLPLSSLVAPPAATTRGTKAARDFESCLVGNLLDSLEKTFAEVPGESKAAGQDEYNYMGQKALSDAVVAAGGLGIAKMIEQHLSAARK